MIAQVNYWSMTYDDITYKWTVGMDYNVTDNGDTITMTSDWGSGTVPKVACNPVLFQEVFGLDITTTSAVSALGETSESSDEET